MEEKWRKRKDGKEGKPGLEKCLWQISFRRRNSRRIVRKVGDGSIVFDYK